MFNESVFAAPPLLKSLVARWGCLHETVVMVHVRRVRDPRKPCRVCPVGRVWPLKATGAGDSAGGAAARAHAVQQSWNSKSLNPARGWAQVAVPVVLPRERMLFSKAGLPGMYRAVLRFGYQDRIDLGPEFVAALVHEVRPGCKVSCFNAILNRCDCVIPECSACSWSAACWATAASALPWVPSLLALLRTAELEVAGAHERRLGWCIRLAFFHYACKGEQGGYAHRST